MYEFNTRFKDSLDTLIVKQKTTLDVLGKLVPTGDYNNEDADLHFAKIIGMLLADAYNDTDFLTHHVFSIQDRSQQRAIFNQIKWRVNECMWLAERQLTGRMKPVYDCVLDVFHNAEYSDRVLDNNPDDFNKFDRAHDRLKDFFKNRVAKSENE